MRKLVPINRDTEAGFYEAACPGQPRFLVLPDEGSGAAAIQLDGSDTRRAFTILRLGPKPIGIGYRAADLSITVRRDKGMLGPAECPIGAAIVTRNGLSIQTVDDNGMFGPLGLSFGRGAMRKSKFKFRRAYGWQIVRDHHDGEHVVFESHPRPTSNRLL